MAILDIAYWEHPSQVIWVDLGHRRLQGFDHYWVKDNAYGMWNDTEGYEGRQSVAWTFSETEEERSPEVPDGAAIYDGFMLTTDQARFVGLL